MVKTLDVVSSGKGKVSILDFNEGMKDIVEQKQREFSDLQHNIVLATLNLKQLQEQIGRDRNAFDNWKKGEQQKFEKECGLRQNKITEKENALSISEKTFVTRSEALKQKEVAVMRLMEERVQLNNDRIDVERLRTRTQSEFQEAKSKMSEANHKLEISVKKDKEIILKLELINSKISENNNIEQRILEKTKHVEASIKNLEAIQENIDPKIKEIEEIQKNIESQKLEIEKRNRDIDRKIEEERNLILTFSGTDKKLRQRELDLASKEEDYTRKMMALAMLEKKVSEK